MKVKSAEAELDQYLTYSDYSDCAGRQWGYCQRHYSDAKGPATSRTWAPMWGSAVVTRSRQECLFPDMPTFPTPQAYAGQINWNKRVRAALAREPEDVPIPAPPSYDTPAKVTHYAGGMPRKGEELGVKFVRALRALGGDWQRVPA